MTRRGRLLLGVAGSVLLLATGALQAADDVLDVGGRGPFVEPQVLNGVLGGAPIQMQLRPKPDIEDGLEGHYFLFGQSHQILLAGDAVGDQLLMEESVNGTDVSGDWIGTRQGNIVTGEWQPARGGEAKLFRLEILRPATSATENSHQPKAETQIKQ